MDGKRKSTKLKRAFICNYVPPQTIMTYIVFAKLFPTFAYEKHTKLPKEDHQSLLHLLSKMFLTSLHNILEIKFISI
jgi:hypothetical protein